MAEVTAPQRFRKRPVEIKAIRFDGTNHDIISAFTNGRFWPVNPRDCGDDPEIVAQVYDMLRSTFVGVKVGNWIACGPRGEFYPIADGVLAETYEVPGKPETFTWGEGLAIEDGHVTIPVNRGDTHIGDLKLAVKDASLLSDMLVDALNQDATQQRAGLERCRD